MTAAEASIISPLQMASSVHAINERVWVPAYWTPASLQTIARPLRPELEDDDGVWLTVYLDDLQDRALAQALADFDWSEIGVRLVVSAQPRITSFLERVHREVALYRDDRARLRARATP